jgi:uncharacterized membrane protein
MPGFTELATTEPLVALHLSTMLGATVLGAWLLAGRKGRTAHRVLGWTWVVLMALAALSSAFMPSRWPVLGPLGPIHLLTLLVLVALPLGVARARAGQVTAHRRTMTRLYVGACAVAGVFTLLPGRLLGQWVWG